MFTCKLKYYLRLLCDPVDLVCDPVNWIANLIKNWINGIKNGSIFSLQNIENFESLFSEPFKVVRGGLKLLSNAGAPCLHKPQKTGSIVSRRFAPPRWDWSRCRSALHFTHRSNTVTTAGDDRLDLACSCSISSETCSSGKGRGHISSCS